MSARTKCVTRSSRPWRRRSSGRSMKTLDPCVAALATGVRCGVPGTRSFSSCVQRSSWSRLASSSGSASRPRQAHHVEEDVERHRPGQALGQIGGTRVPATNRSGPGPRCGCQPRARPPVSAGSMAARSGAPGRAGGCPCSATTPAEPAPARCRRYPCPRSCGRYPDRGSPTAHPRTGSEPTTRTSRCGRPAPRPASSGTPRMGRMRELWRERVVLHRGADRHEHLLTTGER